MKRAHAKCRRAYRYVLSLGEILGSPNTVGAGLPTLGIDGHGRFVTGNAEGKAIVEAKKMRFLTGATDRLTGLPIVLEFAVDENETLSEELGTRIADMLHINIRYVRVCASLHCCYPVCILQL